MKAKVVSGAASAMILAAVTLVVSFVFVKLLVAFLPLDQAGFWFLLMSISQFIMFFDLGFSPTLTRMIGLTLGGEPNVDERDRTVRSLIASLQAITYLAAAVIFFVGAPVGIWILPTALGLQSFYNPAWLVFLLGAVTNLAGGVSLAALNGLGYVSTERLLRAFGQILWLILSYIALRLQFGLLGLAFSWTLQGILVRLSAGLILRSRHPKLFTGRQTPDFKRIKEMFPPSIRWAITSLGAILILQSGNIVITKIMGTSAVPSYEAISRMLAALMMLGILCATASSPFVSRAFGAGDRGLVKSLLFLNVRAGLTITAGAAIFLLLHGRAIVSHWLNPEIFPGESVLNFGVAMAVLEVHHVILATAVMASGPVPFAAWAVGAGILNIAFGFLFVPKYGLAGMAAATFFAQLLTNNWYAPWFALRRFEISFLTYAKEALARPIGAAILLGASGVALKQIFGDESVMTLALQAILFVTISVGVSYLVVFDRSERDSFQSFVKRKLGHA